MLVRVLKNLALAIFFLSLFFNPAQARQAETDSDWNKGLMGDSALHSRIVDINEEFNFVVINAGGADGVKKGMIFSVFQKEEEIAKIKATKVRRHISACDIQLVYSGRGIGIGDLAIFKKASPIMKMLRPLEPTAMIEVEPIVVDIDAPKRTILLKTLKVFEEFGTLITDSDPVKYTLKANKNLETPLNIGLMTEYGPIIKNRVYYTVELTSTPKYNRLIIRLRGVYDRQGRRYNHEIKKTAPEYKEAQEMAFMIKDLSESL